MARLTIEQIRAPDLSVASQALARAGNSFQEGMGNAASLLGKYQAGVEESGDAEIFQEIAKLKTEDELNAYFSSNELAGRPMSAAMRADIMNRRDNVLGYEKKRSDMDYVGANTDSVRSSTAINEGNASRNWRTSDLNYDQRVANDSLGQAIGNARIEGLAVGNYSQEAAPVANRFMGVIGTKVSNPYGRAAIEATAKHESAFSPKNATGTWQDNSQSGRQLRAGGIMSWNGPRYQKMIEFTGGDLSPEAQAQFMLSENPALIDKLNNAKSVEEATRIMNDAWRFAGYNQAGGEADARVRSAQEIYAGYGNAAPQGNTSAMDKQAELTQAASPGLSYGNIAPTAQDPTVVDTAVTPVGTFGNTGVSNSAAAMLGASLDAGPTSTPMDLGSIQLPSLPSAGDMPSTVAPGSLQMPSTVSSTEVQAPQSAPVRQEVTRNPQVTTASQQAALQQIQNNPNLSSVDRLAAIDQVLSAGDVGQAAIDVADDKALNEYKSQIILDIASGAITTEDAIEKARSIKGLTAAETIALQTSILEASKDPNGVLSPENLTAGLTGVDAKTATSASLTSSNITDAIKKDPFQYHLSGSEQYEEAPVDALIAGLNGQDASENVRAYLDAQITQLAKTSGVTRGQAAYSLVQASGEDQNWAVGVDGILTMGADGLSQVKGGEFALEYFANNNIAGTRADLQANKLAIEQVNQLLRSINEAELRAQKATEQGKTKKASEFLEDAANLTEQLLGLEKQYEPAPPPPVVETPTPVNTNGLSIRYQ